MYENLIVVGYSAGYGGDFLSSVLLSNFKNYLPVSRNSNKYDFELHNSLGSLKSIDSIVDHCGDIITGQNINKIKVSSNFVEKYYNLLWDGTTSSFIDNLTLMIRDCVDRANPKVVNFHYHEKLRHHNLFESLNMDAILPKSKKLRLVCDTFYHDLFTLLYTYKTNAISESVRKGNQSIDFFIECTLPSRRKKFIGKPFEDFEDIDVGKLFFEGDENISLTEQQLSDTLNQQIVLNRNDKVKTYKINNLLLLEKLLGSNFLTRSEDENTRLVFQYVSNTFNKQLQLQGHSV